MTSKLQRKFTENFFKPTSNHLLSKFSLQGKKIYIDQENLVAKWTYHFVYGISF